MAKSFPRSGKFGDLDVRRLTFSVEAGPDSAQQLVLRQNPVMMDLDADEHETPLVLAKNVKDFQMQFWEPRLNDWTDEWTQTNTLPKLVMITLKLGDNPHSSQVQEEITKIVSIASVPVQPGWQPNSVPPANPNQNPNLNPNLNPNQNPNQNLNPNLNPVGKRTDINP